MYNRILNIVLPLVAAAGQYSKSADIVQIQKMILPGKDKFPVNLWYPG